jgi:dienelactone hydrolase
VATRVIGPRPTAARGLLVCLLGLLTACGEEPSASVPPAPITTDATAMRDRWETARRLFDYDRQAPLNLTLPHEPAQRRGSTDAFDATYDSPVGGRVPAWIVLPEGDGPFPAVIIMHGSGDNRSGPLDLAFNFAEAGVATILIDAPFRRPGWSSSLSEFATFTPQDRADQIQLLMDLRRAVDVAVELPEIDDGRVGYYGLSYGAAMGGQLAGIEDRIAAFALAVGDGGLVEHSLGPDDAEGALMTLAADQRQAWVAAMEPIEPLYFIGQATAPILLQSALRDEFLPLSDVRRFHAAAPPSARVEWYDSGHELPAGAFCNAAAWLADYLAFDTTKVGSCG